MGTPDFAVPSLEKLIEAGHEIVCVVTQPDKPRGRGKTVSFSPVKETAVRHQIPVFQPVRIKDPACYPVLEEMKPDVIVVAAFGQILPKPILDLPRYGCINVHGSLLPKLRGAAPIQWAVINGETESGVTIMHMDVGLDTGDMIARAAIPLDPEETGGSLFDKLKLLGAQLLTETLTEIEEGRAGRQKQEESCATYAPILRKERGRIDFSEPAAVIERLVRGLNPWPSAYTSIDGKTVKLWKTEVCPQEYKAEPGTVVQTGRDGIRVQTGDGWLKILEVQMEGKKRMEASAFLLGYPLEKGKKLGDA